MVSLLLLGPAAVLRLHGRGLKDLTPYVEPLADPSDPHHTDYLHGGMPWDNYPRDDTKGWTTRTPRDGYVMLSSVGGGVGGGCDV